MKVVAHLDTIVQQVSVDIGFGDVVTPYPLSLDYPLLLPDVPAVELYAYSLETHLDTIVQQVSVDIGFGDVVTPYPLSLDYPLLLPDVPAVELYAYSLETLIAEKFHAMVDRDESNSRMKDFFDVYQLFTYHEIDRAEKFHAMVDRDESNSRMKDFFDVYQLFTYHEIDRILLAEAIASTFKNRNTAIRHGRLS